MPTLLLVRHGRSTANTAGVLAGWTPDVHLDDTGVLAPDMLADLAVLDRDPFADDPSEIGATRVLATYVEGIAVHPR